MSLENGIGKKKHKQEKNIYWRWKKKLKWEKDYQWTGTQITNLAKGHYDHLEDK